MRRLWLVIPLVLVAAAWLFGCDAESPSAPEAAQESAALFGNTIPIDEQTECYKAGMAALEAAEAYGDAAKDLAKCDQAAKGPCDEEQEAHTDAWAALTTAYDAALTACGGGTPPPTGDQDSDGVPDAEDACPSGETGWTSNVSTDFDGDGCRDAGEDIDDDNDGVLDVADYCPLEPGIADNNGCPAGVCGGDAQCGTCEQCMTGSCVSVPLGTDPNNDCPSGSFCDGTGSCVSATNTPPWITGVAIVPAFPTTATQSLECTYTDFGDADGDDVTLSYEWFGAGVSGETSNTLSLGSASVGQQFYCEITADDGTEQTMEQSQVVTIASSLDQDGDGVLDSVDQCPAGESGWTSDATTDHDGDGCRDATEDLDDDNDGVLDTEDRCRRGMTGWTSDPSSNDLDEDGCHDSAEDSEIVKFVGGFIEEDQLWIRGVDYRVVEDLYVQGPLSPVLTIEDGVSVEITPGTDIYVGYSAPGELVAEGTSIGILFTSVRLTPTRGDWRGIWIGRYSQSTLLDGVTVEYAGSNGRGNVVCDASDPTIRNSTIQYSSNYGVFRQNGAEPVLSNNQYFGNSLGPLYPPAP